MTTTVSFRDLAQLHKVASSVVDTRPALPVFGLLQVRTTGGALTIQGGFRGYGSNGSLTVSAPATGGGDAVAYASVDSLAKALKALSAGEDRKTLDALQVVVSVDDNHDLVVSANGWSTSTDHGVVDLAAIPQDAQPKVQPIAVVQTDDLLDALARAEQACGRDKYLPRFMHADLAVAHGAVTVTGTDRFRVNTVTIDEVLREHEQVVSIPAATVLKSLKLARTAGVLGGTVTICTIDGAPQQVVFSDEGGFELCVTTFEEHLPNLDSVCQAGPVTVLLERAHLVKAVAKASATCSKDEPVFFDVGPDGITVGAAKVKTSPVMPGQVDGLDEPVVLNMNRNYLACALGSIGNPDQVLVSVTASGKPVRFEDPAGGGFHVVMAMRTIRP